MKRFNIIALLCAAPLLFACGEKEPAPVDPTPVEPQPETRTLTFVLPSYGEEAPAAMKTAWVAGDQIVVHGEYAAKQVTVTLAASDISSDGKTATKQVEGLYPYVREDCTSTLYASYPAESADNLKHCFFYSKFNTTSRQLLAACNAGDTFEFQDVCGVLSFNLDGEYDSYTIVGARKETLGYEFLQAKLTDKEQLFKQYLGKSIISLDGEIDGNTVSIWMPEGVSMDGFNIKFKKDGQYIAICKYKDPVEIVRGQATDLGDITGMVDNYDDPFSADIRDLDTEGNANCYMITEAGKYKFKAVKGNDATAFIDGIAEAAVLWETWNNAEEVTPGSVIPEVTFAEDYMIVHTPATLKPGNAVIAAINNDGAIVWSWHIWVPANEVQTVGGVFNTDMMDRNLGALIVAEATSSPLAPESFGMMYQWGRKDPFTAGQAVKSEDPATWSGADEVLAPGQISLEESIANPRLLGHINNGDWYNDIDNARWIDDYKTIYDPCPPGYRVPSSASNNFWGDLSAAAGFEADKTNGWMKFGNPAVVFPLCGYRDDYSVDAIAHAYDRGLYWSASSSTDEAKPGYGRGEDARPGSSISFKETPKARGGMVRCVKE